MGTVTSVRHINFNRPLGIVAAWAAVAVVLQAPASAGVVVEASKSLTAASGTAPAVIAVTGTTGRYVVYNDLSHHAVYLAALDGKTAPRVFARNARADAVAGNLVEFTVGTAHRWQRIGTRQHGTVPATWTYLAPDGGMRVRVSAGRTFLAYFHLNGTVERFRLPAGPPTPGVRYSVVASAAGVAVAVSAPHQVPKILSSSLGAPKTFRLLKSTGLAPGATVRCASLSPAAVGCLAGRQVIRFARNGVTAPQLSTLSSVPLRVAVTNSFTSWTAPAGPSSRTCPCTLTSIDVSGTAESIITGVTSGGLAAGFGRFFYSAFSTARTAGVYATPFAGSNASRIAPAPLG